MNAAIIGLLTFLISAEPDVDPAKLVERSLPVLEKQAVDWVETRKCATCHHVPMMVWTHRLARQRGLAVNEATVNRLEALMLEQYLADPELTPTGQDKGFLENGLGPGTIFLSLALKAGGSAPPEAWQRLQENFAKRQSSEGCWPTKEDGPPIIDGDDCVTMLVLLALDDGEARQRGLRWLKTARYRDENTESIALHALVAHAAGDRAMAAEYVSDLLERQQENGGWNQTDELGCDALATGQALVALGTVGGHADEVRRAWRYLAATQREDGGWAVHTRNPNTKSDRVISQFGTAWATLGLLTTMPAR